MKVEVDSDKCQGHNRCMIFAPEVFEVDDYGFATVRTPGVPISAEYLAKVKQAASNCPELAIRLMED